MKLESIAYVLLGAVAAIWLVAMIAGMIAALPFGLLGLPVILGLGFLFIKILRAPALDRRPADAARLGADGVSMLRFVTSLISRGAAELLAYGTAVKLQRKYQHRHPRP